MSNRLSQDVLPSLELFNFDGTVDIISALFPNGDDGDSLSSWIGASFDLSEEELIAQFNANSGGDGDWLEAAAAADDDASLQSATQNNSHHSLPLADDTSTAQSSSTNQLVTTGSSGCPVTVTDMVSPYLKSEASLVAQITTDSSLIHSRAEEAITAAVDVFQIDHPYSKMELNSGHSVSTSMPVCKPATVASAAGQHVMLSHCKEEDAAGDNSGPHANRASVVDKSNEPVDLVTVNRSSTVRPPVKSVLPAPPPPPAPVDPLSKAAFDLKLKEKRERNRLAARKCRDKKLEKIREYEARMATLQNDVSTLEEDIVHLTEKRRQLRSSILDFCQKHVLK